MVTIFLARLGLCSFSTMSSLRVSLDLVRPGFNHEVRPEVRPGFNHELRLDLVLTMRLDLRLDPQGEFRPG